ncbi:hypothetical protein E2562_024542 [Oryza meyeriana var. granulata]|uniref:Uncharacterized protein n=1 Tax=Oryza meyeriana var. granulata TaxID=110450 RepID=A0A6G1BNZ8_9ORYZ|nr:hypothetical protein E2562_024542 [Oryza meyeriana var. granulata]
MEEEEAHLAEITTGKLELKHGAAPNPALEVEVELFPRQPHTGARALPCCPALKNRSPLPALLVLELKHRYVSPMRLRSALRSCSSQVKNLWSCWSCSHGSDLGDKEYLHESLLFPLKLWQCRFELEKTVTTLLLFLWRLGCRSCDRRPIPSPSRSGHRS